LGLLLLLFLQSQFLEIELLENGIHPARARENGMLSEHRVDLMKLFRQQIFVCEDVAGVGLDVVMDDVLCGEMERPWKLVPSRGRQLRFLLASSL
jgi:hypothetical protein